MKKYLIASAIALAFGGAHAADTAAPAPRAENAYLSQVDAAARAARVSNVDYTLEFALTGKESFSGKTTLSFDLSDAAQALTIDLDKANISSLTVNGKTVAPQYNQWFITLAAADLVAGRNTVTIEYTRLHSTNGEGLHRMVDPVDGRVYTYSHFEPAAAHQMFPVFDQPDLKGTYQITVTTPADWVVSSTKRETSVQDIDGGKRWSFPRTKKLSPYNFSMHAGPYKVWEDNSGKYPMRLFARQSVASQVSPADWFKYTKAGLAFFDQYFGIPYQFEKYDQLLVPDFLYGAMENAAAITFAEGRFLHKEEMTSAQKQSLAGVIMHEMAHQWFGDLVTMKWWNGLWLNESFASFMGTLATSEATEFTNAWQSFYSSGKQEAYVQDARVTTHAVETPVPSTANAFDNIDAITYSKGASTLKQLRHLLGEEVFRQGVHNYLIKYQYRNATLDDFIGSLAAAANRDLSGWTQEWLYQPGVNTITADYSCAGGKVSSFTLRQSAPNPELPTLREQRVQVGLFKLGADGLALSKNVAITYKGAATAVPELNGAACPDLVYPNYQDWGFAKVRLDKKSFATAQHSLSKVNDPLLRSMLWQSLWDGVRDAQLPLNEYLKTVLANAPAEKDYTLLGDILEKVKASVGYLNLMGDSAYKKQVTLQLEQMAFKATKSASDKNFQRRWFSTYLQVASSPAALKQLAAILDGKLVVPGLNVSQDVRWDIIKRLNRYAYPGADALLAVEQQKDKSDSGQQAAIAAAVIRPEPKVKAEWLATISDLKTTLPFSKVRTAMGSMYPEEQRSLGEVSAAQRLATLGDVDKAAGPVYMRPYGASMIPATCTPASLQRLDETIAKLPNLSTGTHRWLLVTRQEDQRCIAIKQAMTAH
ncbi:aminopeptidase N [Duganella sp. FT80W]|uniref:Aminopeptidase N n=1 Tax=Duganella guangzhouensis TaxID=2666084 RepID=A0A6I2L704_9BURK|nr:aminopeptidase N [Duganella guangzhouensis]MRW93928.1 aminopeptidase N [Duganella guangzhouensis]